MNWKLYRKDDPNTWPEIDCAMVVYDDAYCDFYICKWNNEFKKFVEPEKKIVHYWKECYYKYIRYIPNGYKTIKAKKCTLYRGACAYEDDGYCFDAPEGTDCMFCKEVTEYHLCDNKIIWKEFK